MAVKKAEMKKTSIAEAKETVAKAAPAKTAKPAAEKETPVKKAVSKAPVRKTKAVKKEVYLQFSGREMLVEEVTQKIQQIWIKEMGRKASEIENFQIYLKPEESAAYYVVNEISGKIEL